MINYMKMIKYIYHLIFLAYLNRFLIKLERIVLGFQQKKLLLIIYLQIKILLNNKQKRKSEIKKPINYL